MTAPAKKPRPAPNRHKRRAARKVAAKKVTAKKAVTKKIAAKKIAKAKSASAPQSLRLRTGWQERAEKAEAELARRDALERDPLDEPLPDDLLARMRPIAETDSALAELVRRKRGDRGPQKAALKVRTTIRLDADLVALYKQGGDGWQTRLNADLRKLHGLDD